MKYFIIMLVISLSASSLVQAQVTIKPSIGMNFTDFSKDQSTGKFKSRPGYQLGGSVAIGKKVYIEPGLFYVRKSTQLVEEGSNPTKVDYNISGVRIPVSVGANFFGNQDAKLSVRGFAGGSAFILTRIEDLDKEDFNSASWGAFAGIGVDISFLFVDASYEWSLTNIQKDISAVNVGKSRSIFLTAGVRMPL